MRHQRGYIFEAHGAFHLRYYVTVDGVRKQRSIRLCAKDRTTGYGSAAAKAVRELAEDFLRGLTAEAPPALATLTVVQFWEKAYLPFIEQNLKPSTVYSYQQLWSRHLKAHFGEVLLRDYKTPQMTNFLTSLAKTQRPRTLASIKNTASCIFAHAVATGEADNNPIRDAMVLGKTLQNRDVGVYSLEEIENVISALVDHVECQLIMALAFFLGLRKGEIQGLQWGDVEGGFLHVRRTFGRVGAGTPKTRKSTRSVPLIMPVRVLLGLWRSKSAGLGWMFPNGDGVKDLDGVARWVIRPALKRAGVPWKGYHAGRRGLGTELKRLTGNSNAGMNVLGHSDVYVTQAHYEHSLPDEALRGMKLLEEKVKSGL